MASTKKSTFVAAKIPQSEVDSLDRIAKRKTDEGGERVTRSTLIRRAVRAFILAERKAA